MLTFLNPIFLIGLGALGVPIFLHLMNRQLPVRIVFPSIRFIRKARLPREGRRRLRDLLVLLLRLAALACAVVALSGPVLKRARTPRPAAGAGDGMRVVVVIDASASMSGWGTRERALAQLSEALSQGPSDAEIAAVVSSNRLVREVAFGSGAGRILDALRATAFEPVAGNHTAALNRAVSLLGGADRRLLLIVSDFQQGDWQVRQDALIPDGVDVRLLDAWGETGRQNAGVVGASVVPLGEERVRVIAEVRNFGSVAVRRRVGLRVGAETTWDEVTVGPLQNRRVVFTAPRAASEKGVVVLSPDAYVLDDEYHVWLGAAPPVRVLAVVPLEEEPAKRDELFFVQKALSIRDESSPLVFEVEHVAPSVLFALDLQTIHALFLLGAGGYLQEGGFARVREFVEAGGTAVFTPGQASSHQFHGLRTSGLFEASYQGVRGTHRRMDDVFGLGWVAPESSFGKVFADSEETDLFLFPVYRYVMFEAPGSATALLRFGNGDTALAEQTIGRGRIYVSALGFGPSWSDLPMTGSFLPLIRELVAGAVPSGYGVQRIECGAPLPEIRDMLGDSLVDADARVSVDTLVPQALAVAGWPLEINVSRQESVLSRANLYDVRVGLVGADAALAAPVARHSEPAYRTVALWPHVAVAAALFLLLELVAAGYLDRGALAGRSS